VWCQRRRAAFTLAEMVMVLAIMSLLLTMSVAAYNSMLQSQGVEGAKEAISSALFTARIKAIRDKRQVTCALSIVGAVDSGYVVDVSQYGDPRVMGVINRMKKPHETLDDILNNPSLHMGWESGQFKPNAERGFWAVIVGGTGSGNSVLINKALGSWALLLREAWPSPAPNNRSAVCIVQGSPHISDHPIIQQYKISSDMAAGAWAALPKFVIVDGTYFPIDFRPDGSAAFPYDHAVIRLRDQRTSSRYWRWRLIIDRGSGNCSISRIRRTDPDSRVEQ